MLLLTGGKKPLKNSHSVIDKPESVNLVKPPIIIIIETNKNITNKILENLKNYNLINTFSYIFAESDKAETFDVNGYEVLDTKIYGKSKLTILKLRNSSPIE